MSIELRNSEMYIQKSLLFLYPILGIKRGVPNVPIETYMFWKDKYSLQDYKFLCRYNMKTSNGFKKFENEFLLGNKYFETWYELEDESGLYIFDYSDIKLDFIKVVKGRYSKLSQKVKQLILNFFSNNKNHKEQMKSYLEPHMYYKEYSKLLDIPEQVLIETIELCSKPDFTKECLFLKEKIISLNPII